MKTKHTPFGMDEGTHRMCEELFANRYVKEKPVTVTINLGQFPDRPPITQIDLQAIYKRMNNEK
jgi:hypothetical protein